MIEPSNLPCSSVLNGAGFKFRATDVNWPETFERVSSDDSDETHVIELIYGGRVDYRLMYKQRYHDAISQRFVSVAAALNYISRTA
jgi:hypothetical protein